MIFLKNLSFGYLLDFYKNILPERTYLMLDMYYNEDLSLSEIADHFGITRQGVRDAVKRGEDELTRLEQNLGLSKKLEYISGEIDKIIEIAKENGYTKILEKLVGLSENLYL